jgi:hypothetical protein
MPAGTNVVLQLSVRPTTLHRQACMHSVSHGASILKLHLLEKSKISHSCSCTHRSAGSSGGLDFIRYVCKTCTSSYLSVNTI